ncbi:MAG TPA: methyltransferase domain-containing protein [Methylomirabilota bacterium]|nr:methyltransferase domain-containing protein [Methylomirabilota bacterium]
MPAQLADEPQTLQEKPQPSSLGLSPAVSLQENPKGRVLWPLFLVSFASLYLEILLIRWIGTEIRVFAYFQNLALIACFLGFGLGCYQSARRKGYLFGVTALASLIILAELPFAKWRLLLEILSSALSLSTDAQLWSLLVPPSQTFVLFAFLGSAVLVSVLLLLIIATMIPVGRWVGSYLDAAQNPITAYSVNLLGSIFGLWLFAGMAFLRLAPLFWFGLAFVLFLLVRSRTARVGLLPILLMAASLVLLFLADFRNGEIHWSPYQKLEVIPQRDQQYDVLVNNTGYMTMANASPEFLSQHPRFVTRLQDSSYDAPWRFIGSRDQVLVVGAGAGNDAAAALRNGAAQVDAVEIDPVIYSLGKQLHPDHPYDSSRVHVILNDARAYLRSTTQRYDVVVFGLLDSHTQFSGYSNMRIDNYVYTEQSLREAKRLLKPGGTLVLKFEVRPPWTWMGSRFYSMFDHIFGRPPIVFYAKQVGGLVEGTDFLASDDPAFWTRAAQPELAAFLARNPPQFQPQTEATPPPVTDDWPYVYHRGHTIPRTYLTVSLILLIIAFLATRKTLDPGKSATWYFFFLGAGFLLLETQLISRLALYFGSTWQVNCVVLSAILAVLVLANLFVQRTRSLPLGPLYALLVVALLAIYFVPWDAFSFSARTAGMLLAAAYCVPLFFAGLIFAETFRKCENKSSAFGSNILGAVAGGLAQNLSFVIGLKALLPLAAVFYALAAGFALWDAKRSTQKVHEPLPASV